jgi:hypothetical protein
VKSVILIAMPEDHGRVRNIVGALNESNLDVYWDRTAPASADWPATVERALSARAVVLFFSSAISADTSDAFVDLARKCIGSGKALCVLLDDVELPTDLGPCTSYDLRGWRSRASSLFMLDLVAGVKAKAAGLDPPTPRAARQLLIQRLYVAVPSAIAALALVIGLYRDLGADKIASPAEAAAWQSIRPSSCEDLRRFLGAHGNGVHAEEAQALLAARRTVARQVTTEKVRPLPLYVSIAGAPASPSIERARSAADERGKAEARRLCEGLGEASSSRVASVETRIGDRQCESSGAGFACSAGGEAICHMAEPEIRSIEVCGKAD